MKTDKKVPEETKKSYRVNIKPSKYRKTIEETKFERWLINENSLLRARNIALEEALGIRGDD